MCIEFLRKCSQIPIKQSTPSALFGGHLRELLFPEGDILVEVWLYIVIQTWNQ